MSFIVSFTPPAPDQTREAIRRRALRQRSMMVVGTMLLIGVMAALPMPVWDASSQLGSRASELRGWIENAQSEEQATRALRVSGLADEAQRMDRELTGLLAPHDRLETTRLLLALAKSSGLVITRTDVLPEARLLLVEETRRADVAVLGTRIEKAADLRPRVTGVPQAMKADRFVLEGRSRASSLLLFCGVLGAMPAPLRLRSLRWQAADAELQFTITIEKLRDSASASPDAADATTEGPDDA